jgi:hypothetical protein
MSDTTSGSTSGAQRTLAEAKAEVAANLALMPILQGIIGNQYLSGTAAPTPTDPSAFIPATLNLFSGSSVPHLPFYIEQVKPANLFTNSNTASMTEESTVSYTFPKLGEYVGMPQVLIVAPALITYSNDSVSIIGASSGDAVRFLVEDLHHSQYAIRKHGNSTANVAFSSGPLEARMFKLSRYIELAGASLPSLSSAPVTAPTLFKSGRDYFPSEDAMCAYCQYAPIYLLRETIFKIQDAQQDIFGPQIILAWHRVWASPEAVPRDELFHGSGDPSQLRVWSAMSQRQWVVTLPTWWGVGGFSQYLANRALHNHDIKFEFKFAPLKSIIVGSNAHVDILTGTDTGFGTHATFASGGQFVCKTTSGALPLNGMPIAAYGSDLPSTAIAASHFAFYFTFHRVWLNGDIRRMLHSSSGKKLAVLHNKIQTGTITNALGLAGTALTYEFTPILSTAAYFWTVIRQSQVVQNKQMNFGGPRNPLYAACNETGEVMPLLNSLEITQETNSEVVWSQTAFWANKVAPHVFAARNRIPDGWYLKNWGIGSPYSLQKRGFANLSALGKLKMTLNPNLSAFADLTAVGGVALESVTYNHFAYTYNSFSWGGGMGGKDWSNGSS